MHTVRWRLPASGAWNCVSYAVNAVVIHAQSSERLTALAFFAYELRFSDN